MAATVPFQMTYKQVAQLARQLPTSEKRKLAKQLAKEADKEQTAPLDESQLTPLQRKTVANIRQGFKEMKLVQEGKLKTRPLSELLNEL